jgi:hypothetical protein
MTTEAAPAAPPPRPAPTVHEAELAPGPSGAVWYGAEIDRDVAVARRRVGLDVVVRGEDTDANRRLAGSIEAAVGPATRPQPPERHAGPSAEPRPQRPFLLRNRAPQGAEATVKYFLRVDRHFRSQYTRNTRYVHEVYFGYTTKRT